MKKTYKYRKGDKVILKAYYVGDNPIDIETLEGENEAIAILIKNKIPLTVSKRDIKNKEANAYYCLFTITNEFNAPFTRNLQFFEKELEFAKITDWKKELK